MPIGLPGGSGGGGGAAAFGGKAVLGAQAAKTSGMNVYLFSPIVSTADALGWDLLARDRDDAVAAVPATKRIFTNAAKTQGILVTLERAGVEGPDGTLWQFRRGNTGGSSLSISLFVTPKVYELAGPTGATYTTADLLTLINAHADLSGVYFGGEDGSSTAAPNFNDSVQNAVVPHNFFGGSYAVAAEALSIIVDETAKTVTYRAEVTDTLGDVATAIEAVEGLAIEYFGGADASTVAARTLDWDEDFTLVTVVATRTSGAQNADIDARIAPYARISPSGTIALAQIPDAIMRDAEFTASAVRSLLGLTAQEVNDLFTGATIADRVITVTQNDGSTFTLTIPQDTTGGTMADGVVSAGAFSSNGETLTLTVDGADDVTINVPSVLRSGTGTGVMEIEFLAEGAEFPSVADAVDDRLYVRTTGQGRIKGRASTSAVGAQSDVADWAQSSYHGEGAGDASTSGAALSAEHDYYYDTTTERFREQIADGTISFVDSRDQIFPDGVTLLSNGSFIAGAGRYANRQAALDYLDQRFHGASSPQVTTFTSWVYFDVEDDDVRVITNFIQSVAEGAEDALIPMDSGAIISLALGNPQAKPDYSVWNFLGHLYRIVPSRHSGHGGSVDFTTVWTDGQEVTDFWPAGTGRLVFRDIYVSGDTVPNPHSGDIIVTPEGAWERFYIFRHEIPSGWYAHDPPEGWVGFRLNEADAEAHTFENDAVVLYGGQVHVSSNYVAPDQSYVTRRYEPVIPASTVYGDKIAEIQWKATRASVVPNVNSVIEADDIGSTSSPIGWSVEDTAPDGTAVAGATFSLMTRLNVPFNRPSPDITGFIARSSGYPVVGGHGTFGLTSSSTTLNFSGGQLLDASVSAGDKLRVNEEIVLISAISAARSSCTVVRGQDSTDAVAHAAPWFAQRTEWDPLIDEADFEWGPGNIFNQGLLAESVNPVKASPRIVISVRYKSSENENQKYIELKGRSQLVDRRMPPSTKLEIFLKREG